MYTNAIKIFLVCLILALGSAPAMAGTKKAPLGFQLMCLKMPEQCRGGGKSTIAMTPDLMAALKTVNSGVNRAIRPRNDKGADVWTVNAKSGDCEDYVLTKRAKLVNMGVPPSALRIAYVKTRSGIGHAILVVKTNKGDYVLDNLTGSIKLLSQTGHRVVSMSGADPKKWS